MYRQISMEIRPFFVFPPTASSRILPSPRTEITSPSATRRSGLGAERVIQLRFARSDDLRCARTAEREALGHDTVEPRGGDRAADLLRLLLRRFERGERDLREMQPRPACVRQVLQDVGQDVARDEKVAAARGYVDIADGFPLDAAPISAPRKSRCESESRSKKAARTAATGPSSPSANPRPDSPAGSS